MLQTPPIEALVRLKKMQKILEEEQKLQLEFIKLGAECSHLYGMKIEDIKTWIKEGKSDV